VDDLALPFGKLRLRAKGSDGGHNGLKSIHALLGTPVYARLRCGIGHPRDLPLSEEDPEVSRYVLAPFPSPEKKELQVLMRKGLEACRLWAGGTFEKAANALTQV
jgi:PTH1 family peptidyl-tRNA hydrolase